MTMPIDNKLKRMPYTIRVGNIPGGLSEFISIQAAVDYADSQTGDWVIEIYPGVYTEGDITPSGAADITLKGIGDGRVTIAPVVAPAAAVIVSPGTLHLENLEVTAPDATMPALRVTGGVFSAHKTNFTGVGAGDAIQQVAGEINLDVCVITAGATDLSTAPCTLNMNFTRVGGNIDTSGAFAHHLTLKGCDLDYWDIASLATGATTVYLLNCSQVNDITNSGTGGFDIEDSVVGTVTTTGTGAILIMGGWVYGCGGATSNILWQLNDLGKWRVLENMPIAAALSGCNPGSTIEIGPGTFALTAQLSRAVDNIKIIGSGLGTRLTLDGVTPVISAGTQDGWLLKDFDVDAGLVEIQFATNSTLHNITVNGLHGTVINPDLGQTNFPGQPVLRVEEIRPLDPAATEIIKDFSKKEYQLHNPTFATPEFISELLNRQARTFQVPINNLWTDGSVGTGSSTLYPTFAEVACAAAGGDSGLVHAPAALMNSYVDGTQWDRVDFDNRIEIAFDVSRDAGSHADVRARVQLKQANAEGVLANDGFGIQIQNYDIYGETFAAAQATVNLGVTMTALYTYRIKIILVPNVGTYFYVNNVLRGVDATQIPAGPAAGACYWVISIDNGAVATACVLRCSPILVWNHL